MLRRRKIALNQRLLQVVARTAVTLGIVCDIETESRLRLKHQIALKSAGVAAVAHEADTGNLALIKIQTHDAARLGNLGSHHRRQGLSTQNVLAVEDRQ